MVKKQPGVQVIDQVDVKTKATFGYNEAVSRTVQGIVLRFTALTLTPFNVDAAMVDIERSSDELSPSGKGIVFHFFSMPRRALCTEEVCNVNVPFVPINCQRNFGNILVINAIAADAPSTCPFAQTLCILANTVRKHLAAPFNII